MNDISKLMLGPSASDDRTLNERNAEAAMAKDDESDYEFRCSQQLTESQ